MNRTESRPDLTGVWEMNVGQSTMKGSVPQRVLMEIKHREPRLIQQILVINAGGAEQRITAVYETNAETINSIGEVPVRTRAMWHGMELVIESRMRMPDREVCFRDHWSLSADGCTLTMAHRDDDLAGQISIFEKKATQTP